MDAEGVVRFFGEADAVVTDAEAQLAGLSLELLGVAFAGFSKAKEYGEDAHGGIAVEAADIGAGALGPGDFLHAGFFRFLKSFGVRPKSARTSSWAIP